MLESYTGRWSRGSARLTLPIGPTCKSALRSSWDSKGFSELHPVLYRSFGRTRRSFLSPSEGECYCSRRRNAVASSGAGSLDARKLWSEKSLIRRNSEPLKFYRKGRTFTRRFWGSESHLSPVNSVAYKRPSTTKWPVSALRLVREKCVVRSGFGVRNLACDWESSAARAIRCAWA